MSKSWASETKAAPPVSPEEETPGQSARAAGTDNPRTAQEVTQALAAWRESLRSVKHSIDEATQAVSALRATLLEMAPLWRSLSELERALRDIQWEEPRRVGVVEAEEPAPAAGVPEEPEGAAETPPVGAEAAPALETSGPEPETIDQEAEASPEEPIDKPESASVGAFSGPRRPLPPEGIETEPPAAHTYTITVEDPGAETPLIPLYRALGRVGRIRNMDLVSYTNGVAVVSFQSDEEVAGDDLGDAIREALERGCRVINRESDAFVVRMEPR